MGRIATFGEKARKIVSGLKFNYMREDDAEADWLTKAEALVASGDQKAIRAFILNG